MTNSPQYEFLAKRFDERFDDLKSDLAEVKAKLRLVQEGYIRREELKLIISPMQERIKQLEAARNVVIGLIVVAVIGALVSSVVVGG